MKFSIKKKTKNSIIVDFSDNSEFEIPYLIWEKYALYKDFEIAPSLLKKIVYDSEYFRVKNYVLRLLAKRSYFEKELKKKLSLKNYPSEIIDCVIEDIKNLGYIDDEKYAEQFVEHHLKIRKYGLNRISNDLQRKGVSRNIIDKLIKHKTDDNLIKENIHILAQKKYKSLINKETDMRKILQKIYSHLASKGYNNELIIDELKKFKVDIYAEI